MTFDILIFDDFTLDNLNQLLEASATGEVKS